jgi:hypothetical protein
MTDVPDQIVLRRNRDLNGLSNRPWMRRAIVLALAAFCVVGVLNLFGQRPTTQTVQSGAARLDLYAPTTLRGGLLFSARFHVHARRDLKNAELVLDPGWAEGMSINTVEPSPLGQGSSNGRVTFQLGHIPDGQSYLLFMQFQVNPTNVAWNRPQNVTLVDGKTPLLRLHRSITIFP